MNNDVPYSKEFDDIYFSREDGLAETYHTFLDGCDLPALLTHTQGHYTIAELGFGTGLNFLATWKLFDETAANGSRLDYVSIEKYPLDRKVIKEALIRFEPEIGSYTKKLLNHYPIRIPGFHQIRVSNTVTLTLIFDDVKKALDDLSQKAFVDCWFLDGFAPAKNPDMWSDTIIQKIATLSNSGARLATFTAAGNVRRALRNNGFTVEKKPGFGRKREMMTAHYKGNLTPRPVKKAQTYHVIGAGLAGTQMAKTLAEFGCDVHIYDKHGHPASEASGNDTGIINPRISATRTELSDYFNAAYAMFIRDVKYTQCGAYHLMHDETRHEKYHKTLKNWCWHEEAMQHTDFQGQESLYLPHAGYAHPRQICEDILSDNAIKYHYGCETDPLTLNGPVILCGGATMASLPMLHTLPLVTTRGQVTYTHSNKNSQKLSSILCYGGYCTPSMNRMHSIGATFQPWLDDIKSTEDDDQLNLDKLNQTCPELAFTKDNVIKNWAGIRLTTKDRFPMIGTYHNHEHTAPIYLSLAHASHGLISSLMAAKIIAWEMGYTTIPPVSQDSLAALNPQRFV